MNPLPPACHAALATHGVTPCVLVDGAMQHAAGVRLARTPGAGLSLFDDLPEEAQALGPWLLSPAQAQAVGLDGSGPGVNWLASALARPDAADHLRHWLRDGHPRGLHYTRLADGRVLRAAMSVWTPAQRAAFCAPWSGWWMADRDGNALALALPGPLTLEPGTTAGWTDAQREALAEHSVVDQLLHSLKGHVRYAASLTSRERRHAVATQVQRAAVAAGYVEAPDQASWIAFALMAGGCSMPLDGHPVHALALRGDALWSALMDGASEAGLDRTARPPDDVDER